MASLPADAQAVIAKCELCDHGEARYFCSECQEDMCKQCKSIHLRSKSGRSHTVISTAREVDEKNIVLCSTHPLEDLQMFCNNCNIPVCQMCIADKEHQSHTFVKLTDAVDKCRKELLKCVSDAKQEISELEKTLQTVSKNKEEYETQHNDTIQGINKRREELKSQTDKAADDLISEVKIHKNQDIKKLEKHSDEVNSIISDKRVNIESCEKMLQTDSIFTIMQLSVEFKHKLNQGSSRNLQQRVIVAPKFVCSTLTDIQGVFGTLELNEKGNEKATSVGISPDFQGEKSSSETNRSEDTSTTTDIIKVANIDPDIKRNCVSTVNNNDAWVAHGRGKGSKMALINIKGEVKTKKIMDFRIYDIAVTSDGDILLTDRDGRSIKKFTKYGECIDVIDTSPSDPYGICVTSHNDILVCLRDDYEAKVVRMTTKGQVKQTIQRDQRNRALFRSPKLITENINGDVCVVNVNTLVVVHNEGFLRFMYPDTSSSTVIDIVGIACDKHGFILVSDNYKDQIHQLDIDGHFVQSILTRQYGINYPIGLSTDTDGKLWICSEDEYKVIVIKYGSK